MPWWEPVKKSDPDNREVGTTLNFSQAPGVRPGRPAGGEREPGNGPPVGAVRTLAGAHLPACSPSAQENQSHAWSQGQRHGAVLALAVGPRGSGQSSGGAAFTSRPEAQRPLQPRHHTALESASPHAFPSPPGGLPDSGHCAQYAPQFCSLRRWT